jgi:hypothetical protein
VEATWKKTTFIALFGEQVVTGMVIERPDRPLFGRPNV